MRKTALMILFLTIISLLMLSGCGGKHEVTLSAAGVTLQPGDRYDLDAACSEEGHGPCLWQSSDISVAHVDKDGVITAVAEGKATVTAVCAEGKEQVSASCLVTVSVCRIEFGFDGEDGSVLLGEEAVLTARVHINDERTVQPVEWSMSGDTQAADVTFGDNTAKIRAISPGTIVLKASYKMGESFCSAEYEVTLTDQINYRLELDRDAVTLHPDESCRLEALLLPEAENAEIKWASSNPGVVQVGPDGTVTAKAPGSAVITASASPEGNTVTAPCLVTVERNEYSIEITGIPENVHASEVAPVSAAVLKNGEEYDGKIVWTVDKPQLAAVKGDSITALSAGSIVLTASFTSPEGDKYSDEAELEILANVYELKLTSPVTEIGTDETVTLKAELTKNGQPFSGHVTWSSSDNVIAQVNEGRVVTLETGTVTITASYTEPRAEGGASYTAEAEIKVTASEYSLRISTSSVSLKVGGSAPLTTEAYRGSNVLEGVVINYTVSDKRVAVATGRQVTALDAGSAVITASWTDPEGEEHTAQCAVTATTPYYVVLEPVSVSLAAGEEIQIIATTMEKFEDGSVDECYEGEVQWQSSSPAAEVKAGVVTAKAVSAEPVVITAIWVAPDGASCRAECTVTVVPSGDD